MGVPPEAAHDRRCASGETALVFYEAYNPTDAPIAGQASFNVVPFSTGGYFDKIACFCFELQVLQPGERVEMPVSFFVDPAMLEDREARGVRRDHAVLHHVPAPTFRRRRRPPPSIRRRCGRADRPPRRNEN